MQPFTNDIFISYRHLDNAPISGATGWIDEFTAKLKMQLGFKLGYEPVIWRDRQLGGADYFADVIMKELSRSKLIVSILSPGYVNPKSEWCMKELSEFHRLAEAGMGVQIGDKSRCIKVVKSFLDLKQHPTQLGESLGFVFYEIDEESHRSYEFSYLPGGDNYARFLKQIDEVAQEVSKLLLAFDQPQVPKPAADPLRTVYLAETASDRSEYRDRIRTELLSRGFRVLPDKELPDTAVEYGEAVSEDLKQARLSIHLIGEKYGRLLDGDEDNSVVKIQNDLAAEVSAQGAEFSRLIWIAPDLQPVGNRQPAFINLLRTSKEAQNGAELLERPFEELKNRIIEKLTPPKPVTGKVLHFPFEEDVFRIYLICDKLDFPSVTQVRDYLFDKNENYEVVLAARESEGETLQMQVIQYHKENLLECDATLVYYGHGNEFWLHSKQSDLRKVRIWGRERPLLKAIYKADPQTDHKEILKTREAVLLEPAAYGGLSEEALNNFVAFIESARAELKEGSGGQR